MTRLREMRVEPRRRVHLVQIFWYDPLDPNAETHTGVIYEPSTVNLVSIKSWMEEKEPVDGVPSHYVVGVRPLNPFGKRLKVRHNNPPDARELTAKELDGIRKLGAARKRKASKGKKSKVQKVAQPISTRAGKRGAK